MEGRLEGRKVWGAERGATKGQVYLRLEDLLVDFPAGNPGHLPHCGHLGRWLDVPARKQQRWENHFRDLLSLRPEVEREGESPAADPTPQVGGTDPPPLCPQRNPGPSPSSAVLNKQKGGGEEAGR